MVNRINCGSCKPRRPCLSHTRIPFNGTCWVTEDEKRAIHHTDGFLFLILHHNAYPQVEHPPSPVRDEYGRWLISTRGHTFDALPLRYLDWLTGQNWLYGEFEKRLHAYLRKPAIAHELDALFPDPDDDSYRPLFWTGSPEDARACTCKVDCPRQHRWHGSPMPEAIEDDPQYQPWRKPGQYQCFSIVVQALTMFEDGTPDTQEPDADLSEFFDRLRYACKQVDRQLAERARNAYREWLKRITSTKQPKPINARTKLKTVKRSNFATCGLRQELHDDGSYHDRLCRIRSGRSGQRAHPAYLQSRFGIAG